MTQVSLDDACARFLDASQPADFIEAVRGVFSACAPEIDTYASPSFGAAISTVLGGIAWTSVNEARRGVDARVDPRFMVGDALDAFAATAPLDLTRRIATQSVGFLRISEATASVIPAGTVFSTAGGVEFAADSAVTVAAGEALVPVTSVLSGGGYNSAANQLLTWDGEGCVISAGVYGGFDRECDRDFRLRIFAAQANTFFFGSACSYVDAVLAYPGVTRAWAFEDGLTSGVAVTMEDKYPCGTPEQVDLDAIAAMFDDECLSVPMFSPCFFAAESKTITPEIMWSSEPDICFVQERLTAWLRENYGLGDALPACDIKAFLVSEFGEFGPALDCCADYPAFCGIYNCVELPGC